MESFAFCVASDVGIVMGIDQRLSAVKCVAVVWNER